MTTRQARSKERAAFDMSTRVVLLESDADDCESDTTDIKRRLDRLMYAATAGTIALVFNALVLIATRR